MNVQSIILLSMKSVEELHQSIVNTALEVYSMKFALRVL